MVVWAVGAAAAGGVGTGTTAALVGVVEAGALEDDADGIEQLSHLAATLFAYRQRFVAERLANVKLVPTRGTAI